jgi:hypothetical protein
MPTFTGGRPTLTDPGLRQMIADLGIYLVGFADYHPSNHVCIAAFMCKTTHGSDR